MHTYKLEISVRRDTPAAKVSWLQFEGAVSKDESNQLFFQSHMIVRWSDSR